MDNRNPPETLQEFLASLGTCAPIIKKQLMGDSNPELNRDKVACCQLHYTSYEPPIEFESIFPDYKSGVLPVERWRHFLNFELSARFELAKKCFADICFRPLDHKSLYCCRHDWI